MVVPETHSAVKCFTIELPPQTHSVHTANYARTCWMLWTFPLKETEIRKSCIRSLLTHLLTTLWPPCQGPVIPEPRTVIALTNDCVFGHLLNAGFGLISWQGRGGQKGRKNAWPEDIVFTGLGNSNASEEDAPGSTALPIWQTFWETNGGSLKSVFSRSVLPSFLSRLASECRDYSNTDKPNCFLLKQ